MPVNETDSSVTYRGNNSTDIPYPIPFDVSDPRHLRVYIDGDKFPTGQWTAQIEGDWSPTRPAKVVSITTVFPVASSKLILIERVLPVVQPYKFEEGTALPVSVIEDAMDNVVRLVQQVDTVNKRQPTFDVWAKGSTEIPMTENTNLFIDLNGNLGVETPQEHVARVWGSLDMTDQSAYESWMLAKGEADRATVARSFAEIASYEAQGQASKEVTEQQTWANRPDQYNKRKHC